MDLSYFATTSHTRFLSLYTMSIALYFSPLIHIFKTLQNALTSLLAWSRRSGQGDYEFEWDRARDASCEIRDEVSSSFNILYVGRFIVVVIIIELLYIS